MRQLLRTEDAPGGHYRYLGQTVREWAAAEVEPGAEKPESKVGPTLREGQAPVVATVSEPIDRFLLTDAPALNQFVGDQLPQAVEAAIEVAARGELADADFEVVVLQRRRPHDPAARPRRAREQGRDRHGDHHEPRRLDRDRDQPGHRSAVPPEPGRRSTQRGDAPGVVDGRARPAFPASASRAASRGEAPIVRHIDADARSNPAWLQRAASVAGKFHWCQRRASGGSKPAATHRCRNRAVPLGSR
jgi:hypothetical protein